MMFDSSEPYRFLVDSFDTIALFLVFSSYILHGKNNKPAENFMGNTKTKSVPNGDFEYKRN